MEYYIMLAISIVFIIMAVVNLVKMKKIKASGLEAEGIVFDLKAASRTSPGIQFPVIRFLDQNNVWITEEANIGLPFGVYKKGQKVKVTYYKEDPKMFFIHKAMSGIILWVFLLAGGGMLIFSLFSLINSYLK